MIARTLFLLALCLPFIARAAAPQGDEMTLSQISPYDFAQTRQRLLTALQARQLTLFAELDHATAAQQNGLTMPPTTVLVFGNPKGGTPLMLAHPSLALDLPYRVLIARQEDGRVRVSYPDSRSYARHGLTPDELAQMAKMPAVVQAALQPDTH
ncbi:Uncharacterized conserved protein [Edwardsiella tarda]|uniref:DUF302 domain-containing protein n=1 Tax=Edwardsiella tarda ATCC 15947 = NBRC 105688 TaxID=667121 RepID=A0AC61TM92_EDWTA|nr:DUF302 domain-containing protein [Edwardsiella tarda]UCQ01789.1 DUF302 domain-containing protein [Edwardsiella tarda ATCC 15947 = NBRC 105688]STD28557.1 Uncharacterized conserved protein [Edwardsiella tarda]